MRLVKLCLAVVLAVGWWQLWHAKDDVIAAYVDERPSLDLELTGVSSTGTKDPEPSPFALVAASAERAPTALPVSGSSDENEPTAAIAITGGDALLSGTVALVDGRPVAGATIRIERITSDGDGLAETVSGPDGTWSAPGLQGGRYRVRAFAPNELATVESSVLVLSRSGAAQLDLRVQTAEVGRRYDMVGPLGIVLGTEATVAVVVSREVVDDLGRLVRSPVAGATVEVSVSGSGRLLSEGSLVTDAGGAARLLIACDVEGTPVASLVAADDRPSLALPTCMSAEALAELEAAAAEERAAEESADLVSIGAGDE